MKIIVIISVIVLFPAAIGQFVRQLKAERESWRRHWAEKRKEG